MFGKEGDKEPPGQQSSQDVAVGAASTNADSALSPRKWESEQISLKGCEKEVAFWEARGTFGQRDERCEKQIKVAKNNHHAL